MARAARVRVKAGRKTNMEGASRAWYSRVLSETNSHATEFAAVLSRLASRMRCGVRQTRADARGAKQGEAKLRASLGGGRTGLRVRLRRGSGIARALGTESDEEERAHHGIGLDCEPPTEAAQNIRRWRMMVLGRSTAENAPSSEVDAEDKHQIDKIGRWSVLNSET
ncbi:hypothetical protein K438DRAFT_1772793 [Mycena galopus ATCC 62051]|nr:hypothetical protein K438DRAFT_1772793 [Mycena galopus ATCC 62051]